MSEYLKRTSRIAQDSRQYAAFISSGSQVVLAGPGSGKTYLLTTKVAKILLEDKVRFPQKVACITFSRKLAADLSQELRVLGVFDSKRIYVGTIHAFCIAEIIMPVAHLIQDRIPNPFRIASNEEMMSALSVALEAQGRKLPRAKWDRNDVSRNLEKYRRLHYSASAGRFDSHEFVEVDGFCKTSFRGLDWSALAQDYIDTLLLNDSPAVDFAQIEITAMRIVHSFPTLATTLAAAYPWIFVDEYQDLSRPFHEIVTHQIQNKKVSVFAIGDQNQCIYEELQGSSPRFIENLTHTVREQNGNNVITLKTNYRSAQNIIDLGDVVLGKNLGYQSFLQIPGDCHVIEASTCRSTELVKRALHKLVGNSEEQGLVSGNVVILSPRRSVLKKLWTVLGNQGEWRISIDKAPDYEARLDLAVWVLEVASWCIGKEGYFHQLIPFWFTLNETVYGITNQRHHYDLEQKLFEVLVKLRCSDLTVWDWLYNLATQLDFKSIFTKYALKRPGDVTELKELFNMVRTSRLRNLPLNKFVSTDGQILLTTLHGSKGLEFDAAIIVGLDQIWESDIPDLKSRLAYVAITRAKTHVYVLLLNEASQLSEQLERETGGILKFWYCQDNRLTKLKERTECTSSAPIGQNGGAEK